MKNKIMLSTMYFLTRTRKMSFVTLKGSNQKAGCFGKRVLTHACYIACMSFYKRVFSHIKRVKQLTALDKSFSVQQYLPCHFLFCLLHMRISERLVTRLACRVIARVPVHSPFSLLSHGGSHIPLSSVGISFKYNLYFLAY